MDWIGQIFGAITAGINTSLAYLVELLVDIQAALVYLWGVLQAIADWLVSVVQKIGAWLKNLWENGIKGLFARLLKIYQQVHDWLEAHLKPIILFLKNLRAWLDRYYQLHILPMINLIQRIRRYLLILRLLHVKFATTLDNWLLKYEQAINKVFLLVRGSLNQVIDWLNLATNPVGLGRLVLVSVATRRAAGALVRGVTGLPLGHFFPFNGPGSFAFERQPMNAADYTDPAKNPPPSIILAPLLSFMTDAELDPNQVVSDADLDASEVTPWGPAYISSLLAQEQGMSLLVYDGLSLQQAVEAGAGNVYNAGYAGAAHTLNLIYNGF